MNAIIWRAIVSEALTFAAKAGADPEMVFNAIHSAAVCNLQTTAFCDVILSIYEDTLHRRLEYIRI